MIRTGLWPLSRGKIRRYLIILSFPALLGVTLPEQWDITNHFFNQMRFVSDSELWGVNDYWATPVEFLIACGGDCEVGDQFIKPAAMRLRDLIPTDENILLVRLTGGDFAVLTKHVTDAKTEQLATHITHQLAQLYPDGLAYSQNVVQAGVAMYKQGDELHELLAQADTALRSAQDTTSNGWTRFQRTADSSHQSMGRQEWILRLKQAIEKNFSVLYAQQAIALKPPQHPLHYECITPPT